MSPPQPGVPNSSNTVSDTANAIAPGNGGDSSVSGVVTYRAHFTWQSAVGDAPSAFKIKNVVALTGFVNVEVSGRETGAYGTGYAWLGTSQVQSPTPLSKYVGIPADTPPPLTAKDEDKTPPERTFENISPYAVAGSQNVYVSTDLGVGGSANANAPRIGTSASSSVSATNTTTISLQNSAGGGYGGYGY